MSIKNHERQILVEPKEQVSVPKPPRIFELINSQEPLQKKLEQITSQIYTDFYTAASMSDREKVALGLLGLLEFGNDGLAALQYGIAQDTGALGETARKLVSFLPEKPNADEFAKRTALEKSLDIQRYGDIIFDEWEMEDDELAHLYKINPILQKKFSNKKAFQAAYIQQRGLKPGIRKEERLEQERLLMQGVPPGEATYRFMKKRKEEELISDIRSFGNYEASYIELLGPLDVLRLRSEKEPKFLLVGADWGAGEFVQFIDKINPNGKKYIIDKTKMYTSFFKHIQSQDKSLITIMDGLNLGFKKEQFDCVFINYLLGVLIGGKNQTIKESLRLLFTQLFAVLKKGGSLCIVDEYEYAHKFSKDELVEILQGAGFSKTNDAGFPLFCLFQHDRLRGIIDENGFGQFKNIPLVCKDNDFTFRFSKP